MREVTIRILDLVSKLTVSLWFIVPIFIACYVGFKFAIDSFYNTKLTSIESVNILIGAIGLTATLSGLSFTASSKCENDDKQKRDLYYAGELLFFSVITFILALLVNYASVGLIKLGSSSKIKLIVQAIILFIQYSLFVGGLSNALAGLTILRASLNSSIKRKIAAAIKG